METSEKIIIIITNKGRVTAKELYDTLPINKRAVFKQLANLLAENKVVKSGKPPKVFYSLYQANLDIDNLDSTDIDKETRYVIEDEFMYITPHGQKLDGWKGFLAWCSEWNMDAIKTAKMYVQAINKYNQYKKDGLIDGLHKMQSTFADVALDKVFYVEFYSIEIFGKTKLGQLLLYAKQSQNQQMINNVADIAKPAIEKIIQKYKIDTIGFIPPTVKRELQFMKQIKTRLSLKQKELKLIKIKTPIIIPQKTLAKIQDRIINARETIEIDDQRHCNNILLIDDAVGSGATLNEVAKKIRQRGLCSGKIIGLAITGSFKGFEVISEV